MSAGEIGGHFQHDERNHILSSENFEESRSCVGDEGKEFRVLRTEYHSCRGLLLWLSDLKEERMMKVKKEKSF